MMRVAARRASTSDLMPGIDEVMATFDWRDVKQALQAEHDRIDQLPEAEREEARETYLLNSLEYEQTLAVEGLEPTRDGDGVQPLGTRDSLNDLAEDTGRVWTPSRVMTTSFGTFVEEYKTEGATLYLDDGKWFMATEHNYLTTNEYIGPDHEQDSEILLEATRNLERWEQHLEQNKGKEWGY